MALSKIVRSCKKGIAVSTFALVGGAFLVSPVLAASMDVAILSKEIEKKSTSVEVPIRVTEMKNQRVRVLVEVKNTSTGKEKKVNKRVKLNAKGRADVKISDLVPDTKYEFRAKVRKDASGTSFSEYSERESARTKKN